MPERFSKEVKCVEQKCKSSRDIAAAEMNELCCSVRMRRWKERDENGECGTRSEIKTNYPSISSFWENIRKDSVRTSRAEGARRAGREEGRTSWVVERRWNLIGFFTTMKCLRFGLFSSITIRRLQLTTRTWLETIRWHMSEQRDRRGGKIRTRNMYRRRWHGDNTVQLELPFDVKFAVKLSATSSHGRRRTGKSTRISFENNFYFHINLHISQKLMFYEHKLIKNCDWSSVLNILLPLKRLGSLSGLSH